MIPDPLNTILLLKDTITTLLLEETRNSLNLAYLSSSIEEQVRDVLEGALREMKADFEVRKKKLQQEIRCLDVVAQRLSKSEVRLKLSDGKQGHSDNKKANKRIRDAQRVLQDYLPRHDLNDNLTIVSTGIRKLCHNLAQIPITINGNIQLLSEPIAANDAATLGERLPEFLSRYQGDVSSRVMSINESQLCYPAPLHQTEQSESDVLKRTSHLSEVHLFSSDSEDESSAPENGSDSKQTEQVEKQNVKNGVNVLNKEYKCSMTAPCNEEHETSRIDTFDHRGLNKQVNVTEEMQFESLLRKEKSAELRVKPVTGLTNYSIETSFQPQGVRSDRPMLLRSISQHIDDTESEQVFEKSFPRSAPRRVLPPVPMYESEVAEKSTVTRQSERTSSTLRDRNNDREAHVHDSIDVEEIKFKETVRSARREIIEKLKSRYAINQESVKPVEDKNTTTDSNIIKKEPPFHDIQNSYPFNRQGYTDDPCSKEPSECPQGVVKRTEALTYFNSTKTESIFKDESQSDHNIPKMKRNDDEEVFFGKLIPVLSSKFKHEPNDKNVKQYSQVVQKTEDSLVEKAIQKFDNGRRKPQLFRLRKPGRSRSVDSINSTLKENDTSKQTVLNSKALLPRTNSCDNISGIGISSSNVRSNTLPRKSVHEDLNDVCDLESSVMIRRRWSQRKSNTCLPKGQQQPEKPAAEFAFHECFKLPDHGTRCHVSRIVTLSNGIVVIFDESHNFLHFYDEKFLFLFHYNASHVVSGIAALDDQKLAVACAYKSKAVIFLVLKTEIVWVQEVEVPCTEWLSDIGHSQKRLFVLCKVGHIHIMDDTGKESKALTVGKSGKLLVHPSGRRFFVVGEGFVSRFDAEGQLVSTFELADAFSVVLFRDKIYIGDRLKHKIVPVDCNDFIDLVADHLKFPSGICLCKDILLVSQFEEGMDAEDTRTILVFRKKSRDVTTA